MSFKKTVIRIAIRFLIHVVKEIFLTEAERNQNRFVQGEADPNQPSQEREGDR